MDNFRTLPTEVKARVFSYLDFSSKLTCRGVCSNWLLIVDEIFVSMKVSWSNKSTKAVLNCTLDKVEQLQIRNLTKFPQKPSSWTVMIPETKRIHLGRGNSNQVTSYIWKHGCKKIQELSLGNKCLSNMEPRVVKTAISSAKWSYLTCLRITIIETIQSNGRWYPAAHLSHLAATTELFKALNAPTLSNVFIHLESDYCDPALEKPLPNFYNLFINFLYRHKNSLIKLNIVSRGIIRSQNALNINCDQLESLRIQDFSINFNTSNEELATKLCMVGNCLKSLTLDKSFWIRSFFGESETLFTKFNATIQKNKDTLKTFVMRRMQLNCTWFDECTFLNKLELLVSNPKNMRNRAKLPALKSLKLTVYFTCEMYERFEDPKDSRDSLVRWITECMTNLEETDLDFYDKGRLTFENFTTLKCNLPELTNLKLTRVTSELFRDTMQLNQDPKIRYQFEKQLQPISGSYCYVFKMKKTG